MHRLALIAALFAVALSGCSDGGTCTGIGTPVGVSVRVKAPIAASAGAAEMEVCWDGACRPARAELRVAQGTGKGSCEGDTCRASAVPTDDKLGFATVPGLPKRPVEVRLTLTGTGSEPVAEHTVTVTPKGRFPNGPECGEGGPNVVLTVEADGTVRES
ncbi:hypothetical protein E1295_32590 [Nonomuraea mesophila]|uniref:Uncharacterized protein n=1 Tax=Nonomuraea mesophila TaxID=2530382 RepID=A0A4R5EXZ3_9ACTN|nr:hypothetical protein [Nonomuraea mesophila]TDE39881.1 hypothetical protein E1295_32590 [Nonomuraea mesophila]